MTELISADEVIDALGGTNGVSDLIGARPSAVSNWRRLGLPPRTYIALSEALKAKGFWADPSIWKMIAAPHKEPAQ